jgi:hypothetical protein
MKISNRAKSITAECMVGAALLSSLPTRAEEFFIYEKDKTTITVLHMSPCKLNVLNTGKEPAQQATVFSRATNAPVARGCWRFADGSLNMLLKLEDGKQQLITAFEVEKRERF